MRKLQEEFMGRASQRGWKFTQLIRDKHKALYKKVNEFNNVYYEAIRIRVQGETKIGDSVIDAGEVFPSDQNFGTYGICTSDYDRALQYYNEITYEPTT